MTVSIITGGSRGIGLAAANRLAAEGHDVVVAYAESKSAADDAVAKIVAGGGRALAVRADVADEHDVAALFDTAERAYGGVDVVVHAAGAMRPSTIADLDLDALDLVLRTNLRGAFVVGREAARRVRPGGAIINFSSSTTRFRREGNAVYTATRAGVEVLTSILAKEMRGRDVTVNAVAPGATATDMLDAFTGGDDAALAAITAGSPMNRLGTPDDIVEVVAFLAGPGRWVNGQTIFANGGAI
ncbi:SDR family oxidoreductase [Asanoa iriomotensis]|uniref:SDR family oxidoreductase n=1 Tax=Asanoa iriomotensis TaxID=234613 RepID=UPI0031E0305D